MPDNLTPEQRSFCMSSIKGKDTGLEIRVRSALHRRGLRFCKHVKDLPGKPDVVFRKARVAVFVDGDFWHGYRFHIWEDKVSDFWKKKINKNRERDAANHRKLREMGWTVIRMWQHDVHKDFEACIDRVVSAVRGMEMKTNQGGMKMSKRKIYYVTPDTNGGWNVKEENTPKVLGKHDTKADAVDHAIKVAKKQDLSQVVIHKKDMKIQIEYTYGKDPYPPKG